MSFLLQHGHELLQRLSQHVLIAGCAIITAVLVGVPLGILIYRYKQARSTVLGTSNIFQTVPSLALLALLIPLLGIGFAPTIVTLVIYALLPIIRNTYTGLTEIDPSYLETAYSIGLNRWQQLGWVELPLALPLIIAGVRTASAMTIGITTIAAFIGAGGLGVFITQGLAMNDTRLILLGAIPTALLALGLDFFIAGIEKRLQHKTSKQGKQRFKYIASSTALLLIGLCSISLQQLVPRQQSIVVASKNFTEQIILGNIIADLLQQKTQLHVIRKLNLGATSAIQQALIKGDVDCYPEYTGTGYMVVLKQTTKLPARQLFDTVRQQYQQRFNLTWLKPLGFSNSSELAMRTTFAKRHHLQSLSDLARIAKQLTIGAPQDFILRQDQYIGLNRVYHFNFAKVVPMEPDLMYTAIHNHDIDVIEAFTTDPRIQHYHLTLLKDDKHFYPSYQAAIVIRQATLRQHPKIKKILMSLSGKISSSAMRQMNYEVDILHHSPQQVAQAFLTKLTHHQSLKQP